jgi:hypothetical protein
MKGTLLSWNSLKNRFHRTPVMAENRLLTPDRLARSAASRYEAILRTISGGRLENDDILEND